MHILGVGLAVHEKLVHPEMRPLHKKLVDQFHMMRTGLHHVSGTSFFNPFLYVTSFLRGNSDIMWLHFRTQGFIAHIASPELASLDSGHFY